MSPGSKIRTLREAHDITQKELAQKIHINRSVLNRIELGTRAIRDDELKKIADFFGVTADSLLGKKVTLTLDAQRLINKEPAYYTDPETAELANEIKDNPELRMLFDVSRHAKKADILTGIRIMKGFLDND